MQALHEAQGLHNAGNVDGAREALLRAKSRFTAADNAAPSGTKAKISAAIGVMDRLGGGLTDVKETADKAEEFLPHVPQPIVEAIKMGITQGMQKLNPAEWLTEPDRVVQKWMDVQGLTTPNDVQRFFEEEVIHAVEHDEDKNKKKRQPLAPNKPTTTPKAN